MTQTTTEDRLSADKWLDQLGTDAALRVMLDSQAEAISALRTALPQITAAAQALHTVLPAVMQAALPISVQAHQHALEYRTGLNCCRPSVGQTDEQPLSSPGVRLPFCSLLKMQKMMNLPRRQILRALPLGQMIALLDWLPAAAHPLPVQASAQRGTQAV